MDAIFTAYEPVFETFLSTDDKIGKSWSDVVFVVFDNNVCSTVRDLMDLAYAFDNALEPKNTRINVKSIRKYFEGFKMSKASLMKISLKNETHFRTDDDDALYLSFDGLRKVVDNKGDDELQEKFKFVEQVFAVFETYRSALIDAKKYPTHWGFYKAQDKDQSWYGKIITGTGKKVKAALDKVSSGKDSKGQPIVEDPYESIIPSATIEVDIIVKYLNLTMTAKYGEKPPMIAKGKRITIEDEDGEYNFDSVAKDIEDCRNLIMTNPEEAIINVDELAKYHKSTLNKVKKEIVKATEDADLADVEPAKPKRKPAARKSKKDTDEKKKPTASKKNKKEVKKEEPEEPQEEEPEEPQEEEKEEEPEEPQEEDEEPEEEAPKKKSTASKKNKKEEKPSGPKMPSGATANMRNMMAGLNRKAKASKVKVAPKACSDDESDGDE